MTVRVLLADDQPLIRAGLRLLIESEPDLCVVAEAGTGREAVALARTSRADVVLMDIRMPDGDGIGATQQIVADDDLAGVRVVVLTTYDTDEYVLDALHAGASGFLVKDAEPDEVLHAIRVVAAGEALLSPGVTRRLIARMLARDARPTIGAAAAAAPLTARETEIVALAAAGLSNNEIADTLVISTNTAKTHVARAMVKLGARDRAQLVAIAYLHKIVEPPD